MVLNLLSSEDLKTKSRKIHDKKNQDKQKNRKNKNKDNNIKKEKIDIDKQTNKQTNKQNIDSDIDNINIDYLYETKYNNNNNKFHFLELEKHLETELLKYPPTMRLRLIKFPQVGVTYSSLKVLLKLGYKIAYFAPTNNIIKMTVGKLIKEEFNDMPFGFYGSNKQMCPYSKKNPKLGMYHAPCSQCKDIGSNKCPYFKTANTDYQLIAMTYEKKRVLCNNSAIEDFPNMMGGQCKKMLENIKKADIWIYDEFPMLILHQIPRFSLEDLDTIINLLMETELTKQCYTTNTDLRELRDDEDAKTNYLIKFFKDIKKMAEVLMINDNIEMTYDNTHSLKLWESGEHGKAFYELIERCLDEKEKEFIKQNINKKLREKKLKNLKKDIDRIVDNIVITALYDKVFFTKVIKTKTIDEEEIEEKKIIISPDIKHLYKEHIILLMNEFTGRIISTGIMDIGKILKENDELNDIKWKDIIIPNFNRTESKHLIVVDTRIIDFKDTERWKQDVKDISNTIIQAYLLMRNKEMNIDKKVAVFAFNKTIKLDLEEKLEDLKKKYDICEDAIKVILISHYRSNISMGVRLEYPIKFLIGTPETPEDAYVHLYKQLGISDLILREGEISHTFINTLGRGIDPKGIEPSITFVIGAKIERVQKLLQLGMGEEWNQYNITTVLTNGKLRYIFGLYIWMWYSIKTRGIDVTKKDIERMSELIEFLRQIKQNQDFKTYNNGDYIRIADIAKNMDKKIKKYTASYLRQLYHEYKFFKGLCLIPPFIKHRDEFSMEIIRPTEGWKDYWVKLYDTVQQ